MILRPSITYIGPLEAKIKGFTPEVKAALSAAVEEWHQKYLPKHFLPYPAVNSIYPNVYQSRTFKYNRQKQKHYGHQRMLEFTGYTKSVVTSSIRISATAKGAQGTLPGANRATNLNNGQKGRPDARAELLAVNAEELNSFAVLIHDRLVAFLNSQTGTVTKKL